ncbi:uncharacterized protein LOC144546581 [Carex rostrata]
MPGLILSDYLINSWINGAQKLFTYLFCRRREPTFSDQHNMNSEIHSTVLEVIERFRFDELPNEMLAEIISSIDFPKDYLHSIAVCRRWRSIAHALNSNPRSDLQLFHPLPKKYPLPMLLQPRGKKNQLHYFYSITNRKVNELHLPEISNKWICGSWRGWLATVDINDKNLIYLLNPITKVTIPLPPLLTLYGACYPKPLVRFSWNIEKIIIVNSEEVAKQSSCTTVAVLTHGNILQICNIGDNKWKEIVTSVICINDVIEFEGLLYIVSHIADLFEIETNPITKVTLIIKSVQDMQNASRHYLAISSGHLLLITRFFHGPREETVRFTVHKLEEGPKGKIWKKLENLHDQVFFVGFNTTLIMLGLKFIP